MGRRKSCSREWSIADVVILDFVSNNGEEQAHPFIPPAKPARAPHKGMDIELVVSNLALDVSLETRKISMVFSSIFNQTKVVDVESLHLGDLTMSGMVVGYGWARPLHLSLLLLLLSCALAFCDLRRTVHTCVLQGSWVPVRLGSSSLSTLTWRSEEVKTEIGNWVWSLQAIFFVSVSYCIHFQIRPPHHYNNVSA